MASSSRRARRRARLRGSSTTPSPTGTRRSWASTWMRAATSSDPATRAPARSKRRERHSPPSPCLCSWGSRVLLALWAALCALWRSGRAARCPMVQAAAEQPASANSPDYYYTVLLPTASTIRTLTHPGAPTPRRRSATALSPSSRRPMASLSGSKSSTTWAPPSGSSTTLTTSRSTSRRPPPTAAGAPAGPKGRPMGSCTQTATTTRAP